MPDKYINVTVSRYDPATDEAPWPRSYQVPVSDGMSVMDALDHIYEQLDETLAYYDHAACQQGMCRRCAVQINGRLALMCQTPATEDLYLEPPGRFPVVRDLVTRWGERQNGAR